MDSIQNRKHYFTDCPFCNQHTLEVKSWEEHLTAWGIPGYRVEYYADRYCTACKRYADELDMELAKRRSERHQKRITHQRGRKRTQRRGFNRWIARMRERRWHRIKEEWDCVDELDDPDYLPF